MKSKSLQSESLLIVNQKSGNGDAVKLSKEIFLKHGLTSMDIGIFFALPEKEKRKLLDSLTHLFVLGGDGSSFSLIQFLLQAKLNHHITVVPLGLGGENVLAKNSGTFGSSVVSVERVLAGDPSIDLELPQIFEVQFGSSFSNQETLPFLWSVHAGFSAGVLAEIEQLRKMGKSDFERRYKSTLQKFFRMHMLNSVEVKRNGTSEQVLDFGVISNFLPYWTSKFRLPTSKSQVATLHTIKGVEMLQTEPALFYSRFLLELISLKLGFYIPRRILVHEPLREDFSVVVYPQDSLIAVDSEIKREAKVAQISKSKDVNRKSLVFIAKLSK